MREYRSERVEQIRKMLQDPEEYLFVKDTRKRKARARATPEWADLTQIRLIYAEAVRLRDRLGKPFRVIHLVPIRSRSVCGFHEAGNLKIVTEQEKRLFGRRFNRKREQDRLARVLHDQGLA